MLQYKYIIVKIGTEFIYFQSFKHSDFMVFHGPIITIALSHVFLMTSRDVFIQKHLEYFILFIFF